MKGKDMKMINKVDYHDSKHLIQKYVNSEVVLEQSSPLSMVINLFYWNDPTGRPLLTCEDIDMYFEIVGQKTETQDIVKETINLQCNPADKNEQYPGALFFRMDPTTQDKILKSDYFEIPAYALSS